MTKFAQKGTEIFILEIHSKKQRMSSCSKEKGQKCETCLSRLFLHQIS
jgi:hypothetical protein